MDEIRFEMLSGGFVSWLSGKVRMVMLPQMSFLLALQISLGVDCRHN